MIFSACIQSIIKPELIIIEICMIPLLSGGLIKRRLWFRTDLIYGRNGTPSVDEIHPRRRPWLDEHRFTYLYQLVC